MSHHPPPLLAVDPLALATVIFSHSLDLPNIVTGLAGIYYVIVIWKTIFGKH